MSRSHLSKYVHMRPLNKSELKRLKSGPELTPGEVVRKIGVSINRIQLPEERGLSIQVCSTITGKMRDQSRCPHQRRSAKLTK